MTENRNSVTGEASIKCTEDIVDLVEQRRAIIAPGLVQDLELLDKCWNLKFLFQGTSKS